jgi:hypothetical protein
MHLYIVVNCKTRVCKTVRVLKHIGEKERMPASEYWMLFLLIIECPTCGNSYDYSDAEEKFWQKELPPPPERLFQQACLIPST